MTNNNTSKTSVIKYTDMKVGDKVHFYGAIFEISSVRHVTGHTTTLPYIIANGEWLEGNEIPNYFGKEKDWTFQGNQYATILRIDD